MNLHFLGAALRSVAVLSRGRADAFEGDVRPARDELVELDEYDEPDSDALESDDSVRGWDKSVVSWVELGKYVFNMF